MVKIKLPIIIIIVFTFGLLCGLYGSSIIHQDDAQSKEIRLPEQYKFINPLLECDTNIGNSKPINRLRDLIRSYIEKKKNEKVVSEVAVYYRDLNNGPWFGVNEKTLFSPASLIKVPMMISYLKLAETDPRILDIKVKNTLSNKDSYTNIVFVPKEKLENKEYTIDELIRRMIVYSDNVAYDLLFNLIDNAKLVKTYSDLGVDISKAYNDPNGNTLTIKDYSSFFRILYNSSYLNRTMSEKALELLSGVDFADGIVAGVPKDTMVSHKLGERIYVETGEKQLHDCGIVYKKEKTYMICIMTRGFDFNYLPEIIQNISRMVYLDVSLR